jgi:hypothetical protein
MKYAVEMGSGVTIYSYIPSFIQIGSGIEKLMRRGTQTHRQHGDKIGLFHLKMDSLKRSYNRY